MIEDGCLLQMFGDGCLLQMIVDGYVLQMVGDGCLLQIFGDGYLLKIVEDGCFLNHIRHIHHVRFMQSNSAAPSSSVNLPAFVYMMPNIDAPAWSCVLQMIVDGCLLQIFEDGFCYR